MSTLESGIHVYIKTLLKLITVLLFIRPLLTYKKQE